MEMNDTTFREAVVARLDWLQKRIASMEGEQEDIRRWLSNSSQMAIPEVSENGKAKPMGPKGAVASIFRNALFREWSPPDVRDELVKMAEAGRVQYDSKALNATHTAIKALLRDGVIEKVGRKYRHSEKAPILLKQNRGPMLLENGGGIAQMGRAADL